MARIKSSIWVDAYLRRVQFNGGFAAILKKGDPDAGAIYIEIDNMQGQIKLLKPAFNPDFSERKWCYQFEDERISRLEVIEFFEKEKRLDPDLWVINIEDKSGQPHIDSDFIVKA